METIKLLKKLVFLLTLLFTLLGCSTTEEPISGNIVGFISLTNKDGVIEPDRSGVQAKLTDLNVSVVSNNQGRMEMANIPLGTYDIIFEKEGYGTFKIFDYQFLGGNVPALLPLIEVNELPSIPIEHIDVSINADFLNVKTTMPLLTDKKDNIGVLVFVSDSANVSSTDYDHFFDTSVSNNNLAPTCSSIQTARLQYGSGQRVYVAVYIRNTSGFSYFDPELNVDIFPTAIRQHDDPFQIIVE